jgi:hypothetical protein
MLCYALLATSVFAIVGFTEYRKWTTSPMTMWWMRYMPLELAIETAIQRALYIPLVAWTAHRLVSALLFAWWTRGDRRVSSTAFSIAMFNESAIVLALFVPAALLLQFLESPGGFPDAAAPLRNALLNVGIASLTLAFFVLCTIVWIWRYSAVRSQIQEIGLQPAEGASSTHAPPM